MRALIQRVSHAHVDVIDDGELTDPEVPRRRVGTIGAGLLILVASTPDDDAAVAEALAEKIFQQRILHDEKSLASTGADALIISQFTLYADARRGRRPSYSAAAPGHLAEPVYEAFCAALTERVTAAGGTVAYGEFGAMMEVSSTNAGPYSLWLDTEELNRPRRG
ncbi:D-aminoacyl-tRNA deacylase [Micrococcoides hystricis]|uniref:D-aminoacyl-tRNA deacylase n=1 Tax=Micrococcoides hystricis TaxID=1572761 RepID=A0ABV6P7N9_9MICC